MFRDPGSFGAPNTVLGLGEWLGASLAPLVVTGAGVVLPPAVELLTQQEVVKKEA